MGCEHPDAMPTRPPEPYLLFAERYHWTPAQVDDLPEDVRTAVLNAALNS